VARTCNPNTQEAEEQDFKLYANLELHSKTLPPEKAVHSQGSNHQRETTYMGPYICKPGI
jgi:hypothetical protein